jgi:K+-sensing histidine kinase KdpD
MSDERTSQADALLGALRREGAGRLTIFLGAAPGVGKTYAMLSRARELKKKGVDLVIGIVETHGRRIPPRCSMALNCCRALLEHHRTHASRSWISTRCWHASRTSP